MLVHITRDFTANNELLILTKTIGESNNGIISIKNGDDVIKELKKTSSDLKHDSELGEDEIFRQECYVALEWVIHNGYKKLTIDTAAFVDVSGNNTSYIVNELLEILSQITEKESMNDVTVTLLFPKIESYDTVISELDDVLSKPVKIQETHLYGDGGDPLMEQFKEFQKSLGQGKLFREYLIDLMDRKNIRKSTDVYKPSGISKYTFSKLINFSINPPHKPSKETVAALSIGLKLNIEEAEEMYNVAGYSLGKTEFVDKVIRFFIYKKIYKIDEVNYCLAYHGYPLLGERMRGENNKIILD